MIRMAGPEAEKSSGDKTGQPEEMGGAATKLNDIPFALCVTPPPAA
jgi:hypothetical protein